MTTIRSATLALSLLAAGPAAAHVTLETQQAPANAIYRATFRIPHGCDGAAMTRFIVRLPESVTEARPMPKPGWTLRTVARGEAASGHGSVPPLSEIIWEGGRLEDAQYDEFVVRLRLPDRPGELFYIPVIQECEGGKTAAWIEIPEPGVRITQYRYPAPAVRLAPRN